MGREHLARRADARQFEVAVGRGTAMARNMLDDGSTPPAMSPSAAARPPIATASGSCHRRGPRSPASAPGTGTSSTGTQSTVMPSARKLMGDEARAEP